MSLRSVTVTFHEAAHAVIAWKLRLLHKSGASIIPTDHYRGRIVALRGRGGDPLLSNADSARLRVERQVMLALAGMEAERKYTGRPAQRYRENPKSDWNIAIDNLSTICWPSSDAFPVYRKLLRIRTRDMVEFYWPQIEAVAAALMKHKTLTRDQIISTIYASVPKPSHATIRGLRASDKQTVTLAANYAVASRRGSGKEKGVAMFNSPER